VSLAKAAARKAGFARRAEAHRVGAGSSSALAGVLAGHRGKCIAGYLPIRSEIDPRPAMAAACAHGPVCVPVIMAAGQPLRFARWTPDMALVEGAFGAYIPAAPDWLVPGVLIVPLVAFTAQGHRLGYGGGFYDRTLERLRAERATLAIGFAYAEQEAPSLPTEPTDQPLDMIVTQDGVVTPLRAARGG